MIQIKNGYCKAERIKISGWFYKFIHSLCKIVHGEMSSLYTK